MGDESGTQVANGGHSGFSSILKHIAYSPQMPNSTTVQSLKAGSPHPTGRWADYLSRPRIDCLDGLRAIGILAVVYHHVMHGAGRLGASLFLLLSGYLVTTLLLREQSSSGSIDLARFETRRYLRLLPLYFAVLTCYVVLVWCFESDGVSRTQFFNNLPAFASLTSNLFVPKGEHVIFFFAWTMAAQEQFHFVWSRMLKYLGKKIALGGLVSTLCTVYVVSFLGIQPNAQGQSFFWTIALSIKPTLLLGALLAMVLSHRVGFAIMSKLVGFRFAPLVFSTAVILVWRVREIPDCFMHLSLVALLASCVVPKNHNLTWLLQHPVLVFIGNISFGIYMTHMLCLHVVAKMLQLVGLEALGLQFLATFLLAVGVATLSNRYFESAFISRKKPSPSNAARIGNPISEAGREAGRKSPVCTQIALAP